MKVSQEKRIIKDILQNGKVSRNYYYNLPLSERITRLGAIVNVLNDKGWEIEGKFVRNSTGKDFVYFLKSSPYKKVVRTVNLDGEIKEVVSYEILTKNR